MATIVPMGDNATVRVVPKVFADIPSQRELDDAKRSRNSLVLWVVLLAGALIAAVAFIVYLTVLQKPVVDTSVLDRIAAAEKARDTAIAERDARQTDFNNLQGLVGEFRGIAERQRQFGQLQADIRTEISPPTLPEPERKAREASVRNSLRLAKLEWAAFDGGAQWSGTSRDQVQANLDNQVNLLISLKQKIDALNLAPPPANDGSGGVCTDVTKC